MRLLKKSALLLLLGFLPVGSGCTSALFYPTRYLYYDPEKMGFRFDQIRFPSGDGTQLAGWYFRHTKAAEKTKAVIFFAHGNGQNMSSHFSFLSWVLDYGYDFFIFDYRGYGPSEGDRPNAREGVEDTIAALRWTDARAKELQVPLVAFGQSLGSALLVRALVEERATIKPAFIGLESSFISFQWAGASVLSQSWITTPFQPLAFIVLDDEWAPLERIRELSPTPILFIHSDRDPVIDYRLGRAAFEAALSPKEFVTVKDGGHIQAFWGPEKEKYRSLFLAKMDDAVRSALKAGRGSD